MAKRRDKGFQWVREDQEEEARPRIERAIRQREKDEARELELWVRRLAEVPRGRWHTLGISDEVLKGLEQYTGMSRTPARGRGVGETGGWQAMTAICRHSSKTTLQRTGSGSAPFFARHGARARVRPRP